MTAELAGTAPLLVAEGARVAVDAAVAIDGLDCVAHGGLLVIAGDADAFVAAVSGTPLGLAESAQRALGGEIVPLAGYASVVSGSLRVAGHAAGSPQLAAALGYAPLDPPVQHDQTAGDYASASLRLALARHTKVTRALVDRKLAWIFERSGVTGGPKRRFGTYALPEKRAFFLGLAAAADAEVLLADRPLSGLDGQAAAFVLAALERAGGGRRAIVRVTSLTPGTAEGDFARRADQVAVFSGGGLGFFGPLGARPAGERLYRVTVRTGAEALQRALGEAGLRLEGGPSHFTIALPAGRRPLEVLRAAAATRATVVEVTPLM